MTKCKNCNGDVAIKNVSVRGKQRYKCKECGYNFAIGDERTSHSTEVKKALSIILYSLGKSSCGFLGKLFGVSQSKTYKMDKAGCGRYRKTLNFFRHQRNRI